MVLGSRLRAVPILVGLVGLVAFATPAAAKGPHDVPKVPRSTAKGPHDVPKAPRSTANGPHDVVKVPRSAAHGPHDVKRRGVARTRRKAR